MTDSEGWILSTITDEVSDLVLSSVSTASALWTVIHDLFHDNKHARAMQLEHQFRTIVKGSTPMAAYCQELRNIADWLDDVDAPVSEHQLILQMLCGLPNDLQAQTSFLQFQDPMPSFLQVWSALLLLDWQRTLLGGTSSTALLARVGTAAASAATSTAAVAATTLLTAAVGIGFLAATLAMAPPPDSVVVLDADKGMATATGVVVEGAQTAIRDNGHQRTSKVPGTHPTQILAPGCWAPGPPPPPTPEELAILQRKWVELVQANQKTVLENHQLVAERNRLKESISELEKKIEDLEGQQSDLKYELNQLKNFHKWMRSAGAKAIEEQVNVSKFYGDKTGLGFSGSESNKTPLDLFVDRRKEIAQKVPQGRKTEAAASAGTSSAKPAEASHEASAGTIYAAPYAKRQRVVTQSSMRRHKDHYAKPERYSYKNFYANYVCFCCGKRGHIQRKCKIFTEQRHRKKNVTTRMVWVPKNQYKTGDNPWVKDVASDQCHVSSASLHQEEKKTDCCAVKSAESSRDEVTRPSHESVKFMTMKKRALGMCKRAFDGNRFGILRSRLGLCTPIST
ncbi:unnamed protein product [Cuscuta campestris]|uniref:CCHC-type domain-containing protein n=1 Tax=Cuscuta campestris TaxID=132261 RepID=A0A484M6S5_9ASTE|nr:unnamed protein product [Cuscuta campestris]